jgi:hypothetical protein
MQRPPIEPGTPPPPPSLDPPKGQEKGVKPGKKPSSAKKMAFYMVCFLAGGFLAHMFVDLSVWGWEAWGEIMDAIEVDFTD